MDYAQSAQKLATDKSSVLPDLHGRFVKSNNEQGSLLNEIEDKLHKVLNKKVPTPDMSAEKGRQDDDFVSSIESQLSNLQSANRRLEKILCHLNEII